MKTKNSMKINNSKEENGEISSGEEGEESTSGWANSIAKVLQTNKPKSKKSLILSRAKNLTKIKHENSEEPKYNFEIVGEIKEEKPETKVIDEVLKKKKEKNKKLSLRMKPTLEEYEREKILKNIATKGVVQLFNAVRAQQKDLDQKIKNAGPLSHRKDAVLNNIDKKTFLNVLMSGKRAKSENVDNPIKNELKEDDSTDDDIENVTSKKSEWDVLRDDFMTNKKYKNWDQETGSSSDDNENSRNVKRK